jgi:hypothetical protein
LEVKSSFVISLLSLLPSSVSQVVTDISELEDVENTDELTCPVTLRVFQQVGLKQTTRYVDKAQHSRDPKPTKVAVLTLLSITSIACTLQQVVVTISLC